MRPRETRSEMGSTGCSRVEGGDGSEERKVDIIMKKGIYCTVASKIRIFSIHSLTFFFFSFTCDSQAGESIRSLLTKWVGIWTVT